MREAVRPSRSRTPSRSRPRSPPRSISHPSRRCVKTRDLLGLLIVPPCSELFASRALALVGARGVVSDFSALKYFAPAT